jgi:hypothetical protein
VICVYECSDQGAWAVSDWADCELAILQYFSANCLCAAGNRLQDAVYLQLGENEPVTIHFSDAVGEILVTNRRLGTHLPNFKYYI